MAHTMAMAATSKKVFRSRAPRPAWIAAWNEFMIEKKPRNTLPAVNRVGRA